MRVLSGKKANSGSVAAQFLTGESSRGVLPHCRGLSAGKRTALGEKGAREKRSKRGGFCTPRRVFTVTIGGPPFLGSTKGGRYGDQTGVCCSIPPPGLSHRGNIKGASTPLGYGEHITPAQVLEKRQPLAGQRPIFRSGLKTRFSRPIYTPRVGRKKNIAQ